MSNVIKSKVLRYIIRLKRRVKIKMYLALVTPRDLQQWLLSGDSNARLELITKKTV